MAILGALDGVSLVCNDERGTSLEIDFEEDDPFDWNVLRLSPKLQKVTVSSFQQSTSEQHHLLELGLAIRRHPAITHICFEDSFIEDIAPLCVAFVGKDPLVTLDLVRCDLGPRSVQSIGHLLEDNLIEALLFDACGFPADECGVNRIAAGLRENQSLKSFEFTYHKPTSTIITSLQEFAANNKNLVELRLTIKQKASYWDLFRAVEQQNTLQSLQISRSRLDLESMEALVTICLAVTSLKTLHLSDCVCDKNALEFLARTLSKVNAIDVLILDCLQNQPDVSQLEVNVGNVQVKKLVLTHSHVKGDSFSQMLESVANNPVIDCLEATDDDEQHFRQVCEILLRRNIGPTELVIGNGSDFGTILSEAMQVNTTLKSLSIDCMYSADLVTVAEGLANMHGLRKLSFKKNCWYKSDFFRALRDSMERNTTLCTLSLDNIPNDESACFLPRIHYLLAINRVGRHRLMTNPAPVGLWAHVLERSSNEPNGIYFALTEKPDIIRRSSKRKRRDDEVIVECAETW